MSDRQRQSSHSSRLYCVVFTLRRRATASERAYRVDIGLGASEHAISAESALVGYSDWPGLAQCLKSRHVYPNGNRAGRMVYGSRV